MSQEELAALLKMDKGTTARAIDKLEEQGYVMRKKNVQDKRAYHLYVTQKAKDLKSVFYQKLKGWTDILVEGITQQERDLFFSVIERMMQNATGYVEMCHMKKKG
jgi:DNA-binding MarR family transcriptional regulator